MATAVKNPDDDFDKLESLLEEEVNNQRQAIDDELKKSKRFTKDQKLSIDMMESKRQSNGAIDTQMTHSMQMGGTFRDSIIT